VSGPRQIVAFRERREARPTNLEVPSADIEATHFT
jgi:hypothetical protein